MTEQNAEKNKAVEAAIRAGCMIWNHGIECSFSDGRACAAQSCSIPSSVFMRAIRAALAEYSRIVTQPEPAGPSPCDVCDCLPGDRCAQPSPSNTRDEGGGSEASRAGTGMGERIGSRRSRRDLALRA